MSEREKRLALVFGAVLVVGIGLKYVYPTMVRPTFDYGANVREAGAELQKLQAEHGELQARLEAKYDEYVLRTGGTDPDVVKDDMYDCINELLKASKLRSTKVNPKSTSVDKKSGIATLRISVSAKGRFAQCIGFVKRFYAIPYVARFSSLKFAPTHARQRADHDEVKLDAEIEVLVVPYEKLLGEPKGDQPPGWEKSVVKNTRALEAWKPFTRYREPDEPAVTEPVVTQKPPPEPTPPPELGVPVSPNAAQTFMRMVLRYGVDEVLLEDRANDSAEYVAVGDALDAGELVLVHALGAVAHKERDGRDFGYYVYPLGKSLAHAVSLEEASAWPEIQAAMKGYFDEQSRQPQAPAEQSGSDAATHGVEGGAGITEDVLVVGDGDFVGPPFLPDERVGSNGAATSQPAVEQPGSDTPPTDRPAGKEVEPSHPAGEVAVQEKEAQPKPERKLRRPTGKRQPRQAVSPRPGRKGNKSDAD